MVLKRPRGVNVGQATNMVFKPRAGNVRQVYGSKDYKSIEVNVSQDTNVTLKKPGKHQVINISQDTNTHMKSVTLNGNSYKLTNQPMVPVIGRSSKAELQPKIIPYRNTSSDV